MRGRGLGGPDVTRAWGWMTSIEMINSIGAGGRPDCLAPIPQTLAKLETMTEEEKQRWRENKAARVQSQRATVQEKRERLRQVCLGVH